MPRPPDPPLSMEAQIRLKPDREGDTGLRVGVATDHGDR